MGQAEPADYKDDHQPQLFSTGSESSKAPDTERLIRRAFEQDADSGISLLFRHYYPCLCSHAVRFVSSKEIAEDIVSDIFYEFHAGQLAASVTTSFRAFLFTAVRNRAFDYVRAEIKRNTSLDYAEVIPLRPDQQPDSLIQYDELCHDVEKAINALPQKRQQVYLMHRYEGKKYDAIATELHLSKKTVEIHMHNAIHQIRRALKDKGYLLWLCLFASQC